MLQGKSTGRLKMEIGTRQGMSTLVLRIVLRPPASMSKTSHYRYLHAENPDFRTTGFIWM